MIASLSRIARPVALCLTLTLAFALGACTDVGCDADQVYVEGSCIAASTGGITGSGGAPSDGGAAGAAGAPGFGSPCTSSAQCAAPASFCAAVPGQPGICTARGCNADADVCPDGYTCQEPVPSYDLCVPD